MAALLVLQSSDALQALAYAHNSDRRAVRLFSIPLEE
jgi:hypothetical protein